MDAARARKLGDRIARIVAEMLERRVKDPRLGFVTVTAAKLSNDLREATVFYTVYGSPEERAETAAALASATGLIRAALGHPPGLRTPAPAAVFFSAEPQGAVIAARDTYQRERRVAPGPRRSAGNSGR